MSDDIDRAEAIIGSGKPQRLPAANSLAPSPAGGCPSAKAAQQWIDALFAEAGDD